MHCSIELRFPLPAIPTWPNIKAGDGFERTNLAEQGSPKYCPDKGIECGMLKVDYKLFQTP